MQVGRAEGRPEEVGERCASFALGMPGAAEEFPWGETVAKVDKKVVRLPRCRRRQLSAGRHASKLKDEAAARPRADLPRRRTRRVRPREVRLGERPAGAAQGVPAAELLCDWVEESYRTIAPKRLTARARRSLSRSTGQIRLSACSARSCAEWNAFLPSLVLHQCVTPAGGSMADDAEDRSALRGTRGRAGRHRPRPVRRHAPRRPRRRRRTRRPARRRRARRRPGARRHQPQQALGARRPQGPRRSRPRARPRRPRRRPDRGLPARRRRAPRRRPRATATPATRGSSTAG